MKRAFIAVLTGWLPFFSFGQANQFVIDGKIEADSLLPGKIYLIGKGVTRDSCELKDNTYHLSGTMQHPGAMVFVTWCDAPMEERIKRTGSAAETGSIQFFLEPGHIHIAHKKPFETKEITGSQPETDFQELRKEIAGDKKNIDGIIKKYIVTHPDSWLSFAMLKDRMKFFGPEVSDSLYQGLGDQLKKDNEVAGLGEQLSHAVTTAVGKAAPDFTLNDPDGHAVTLSSYRGKYVLVDFWASWCKPCREENPTVKGVYGKYHERGLEVLGVSMDLSTSRQAWLNAITSDGLSWMQVSDLKGFDGTVAVSYGVHAIPANFLVDPSGKIIASNLRGYELEKRMDDLFKPALSQHFEIDGKFFADTVSAGKVYLMYNDNGKEMRDSSVIVNNTYHFEGDMVDGAIQANLIREDRSKGNNDGRFKGFLQIYAVPGKVTVSSTGRLSDGKVSGSPVQQDADLVARQRRSRQKPEKEMETDFIKTHPGSWLSFILLEQRRIRMADISVDEADTLYAALSPELKKYKRVAAFKALIDGSRAAVVGKAAPAFTQTDMNGKLVKLSDYKGKYVLVDFWASWCHPCRAENPNVTAAYHKYKDKGLNILSVSLDGDRTHWVEAVAHDKLEWTQVSNLKAFDDEIAVKYGIHAIPSNFLIDPNGIIVGLNLRGEQLEEKLGEVLK